MTGVLRKSCAVRHEAMPGIFAPTFTITPAAGRALIRIEAVKRAFSDLPIKLQLLTRLHDTARLLSTHCSTRIEGNHLTLQQVTEVITRKQHFLGRGRDESEVRGYYAALDQLERMASAATPIVETTVKRLHALVEGDGKTRVSPTPYRDGQNVIRDARSRRVVYMPPEAKDVPRLTKQLIAWIGQNDRLPVPVRAGLAHYQFATIHPFYDGNGRTARLLTTLILHLNGYGMKGLCVLDEHYVRDLRAYYAAISVGDSHNYYMGRAEADVTAWVTYFVEGMAEAFEKTREQVTSELRAGPRAPI